MKNGGNEMAMILEPTTKNFLEKMSGNQPVHMLPIEDGRKMFTQMQSGIVNKPDVILQEETIATGKYGNVPIIIYRPKHNKSVLPVVIYIHGAGWVFGGHKTHDRLVREITNGAQVAVVFVNYSLSPEAQYPTAIEQAYEVSRYISQNAKALNLDANQIAIAGDSVGGNMTAAVTLLAKERGDIKFNCQVLLYPVTSADFNTESYSEYADGPWLTKKAMQWFWDNYLPNKEKRNEITASPLKATINQLRSLPPALVILGEMDVLRDEGYAYAHKLIEAEVPVTAKRYIGTIHDFMLINDLAETPATRDAISTVNSYLRQAFKL